MRRKNACKVSKRESLSCPQCCVKPLILLHRFKGINTDRFRFLLNLIDLFKNLFCIRFRYSQQNNNTQTKTKCVSSVMSKSMCSCSVTVCTIQCAQTVSDIIYVLILVVYMKRCSLNFSFHQTQMLKLL